MTEEEYFRKNYPDSCYGDRLLSPHWDFFQEGVEFGERESEKKIADLEEERNDYRDKYETVKNESEVKIAELTEQNTSLLISVENLNKSVQELEAQLEREKNLNQCLSDNNEQLRKLIEKMKCCYNCSKWNDGQCADIPNSSYYSADFVCEDWEIKEK